MKTFLSIILAFMLIGGLVWLTSDPKDSGTESTTTQNNVSVVNGRQIVRITAKGGYWPRQTVAKANLPTTIKVTTNGSFDCSVALTIPALKHRSFLPATGETDIDLPEQKPGSIVQGLCAMGMYSFVISFN